MDGNKVVIKDADLLSDWHGSSSAKPLSGCFWDDSNIEPEKWLREHGANLIILVEYVIGTTHYSKETEGFE